MDPEQTTDLTRPTPVRPRTSPGLVGIITIVATTTALGFGFGVAAMTFGPAAAPTVVLHAIDVPCPVMPAAIAPEPEPALGPAEIQGPTAPRASAPTLDPACVLPAPDGATASAACAWDDGFPAISRDGGTIVVKATPDDGGRGYPSLYLNFIDVHTSKITRTIQILSADEYSAEPVDRPRLAASSAKRVVTAQKLLDAGHYRPLSLVGSDQEQTSTDPTVRVELDGDAVRMFDVDADERVLWQHHFTADHTPHDPESECGGGNLVHQTIYWDHATRTVLAAQAYHTGGCMCPDLDVALVAQMP